MTGSRPDVARRLSLGNAARFGQMFGRVHGVPRRPRCGHPLRSLVGTSGDGAVSLVSCNGCGLSAVLETNAPPSAAS
jgi:hypothetical protein